MFEVWSYQSIASTLRIIGMPLKLLVLLSSERGSRFEYSEDPHGLCVAQSMTTDKAMSNPNWCELAFPFQVTDAHREKPYSLYCSADLLHQMHGDRSGRHAMLQSSTAQPAQKTAYVYKGCFSFSHLVFFIFSSRKMPFTWEMQRDCETPTPWLFRAVNSHYVSLKKSMS